MLIILTYKVGGKKLWNYDCRVFNWVCKMFTKFANSIKISNGNLTYELNVNANILIFSFSFSEKVSYVNREFIAFLRNRIWDEELCLPIGTFLTCNNIVIVTDCNIVRKSYLFLLLQMAIYSSFFHIFFNAPKGEGIIFWKCNSPVINLIWTQNAYIHVLAKPEV